MDARPAAFLRSMGRDCGDWNVKWPRKLHIFLDHATVLHTNTNRKVVVATRNTSKVHVVPPSWTSNIKWHKNLQPVVDWAARRLHRPRQFRGEREWENADVFVASQRNLNGITLAKIFRCRHSYSNFKYLNLYRYNWDGWCLDYWSLSARPATHPLMGQQ